MAGHTQSRVPSAFVVPWTLRAQVEARVRRRGEIVRVDLKEALVGTPTQLPPHVASVVRKSPTVNSLILRTTTRHEDNSQFQN